MAKRRREGPKHPGVTLCKPNEKTRAGWRARYTDPDTNRTATVSVPARLTQAGARADWAAELSKQLAQRRVALDAGATRARGVLLSDALDHYFADHKPPRISKRSVVINRTAANKLIAWAKTAGVRTADELKRPGLLKFRATLISERKRVQVKGGKRGEYVATDEPRSASAVNQDLSALRTVLGYVRDLDLCAHLTHDDLRRALKKLDNDAEKKQPLTPEQCVNLLRLALAHDAECFEATRAEQKLPPDQRGKTIKYPAIAPFLFFVLVTGMRRGEALAMDWSWIDLDALDEHGQPVGEIRVPKGATKTRKARIVSLEVSSTLRRLLVALAPREKDRVGSVFDLSKWDVAAAIKRLRERRSDPEWLAHAWARHYGGISQAGIRAITSMRFTWQKLRVTCATYLCNAPGIFGAASAYREAKQLGHSVPIAEKHYAGLVRGIPREARTLEAALRIETQAADVLSAVEPVTPRVRALARPRLLAVVSARAS